MGMTTDQIAQYYAGLLILQYLNLPKASQTIYACSLPFINDQVALAVQNAYNLFGSDTAVGVQLDVIGKYAGVSRNGVDLLGNPITLDDSDYLQLIKLVIIKNNSGSSLSTIENLLAVSFPGQIIVTDSADMTLQYTIFETIGTSNLLALLATGGYLPKPMGVGISVTILPVFTTPIFGLRTYANPLPAGFAPLNNYTLYRTNYHWLSYQD